MPKIVNFEIHHSIYQLNWIIFIMKDEIESFVNDVKLYSGGLITALENNRYSESQQYVQNMQNCLRTIEEYLVIKKDLKE